MYAMSVNEITKLTASVVTIQLINISYTGAGVMNFFALRDVA